jgi:uncharacterized membrane protein
VGADFIGIVVALGLWVVLAGIVLYILWYIYALVLVMVRAVYRRLQASTRYQLRKAERDYAATIERLDQLLERYRAVMRERVVKDRGGDMELSRGLIVRDIIIALLGTIVLIVIVAANGMLVRLPADKGTATREGFYLYFGSAWGLLLTVLILLMWLMMTIMLMHDRIVSREPTEKDGPPAVVSDDSTEAEPGETVRTRPSEGKK